MYIIQPVVLQHVLTASIVVPILLVKSAPFANMFPTYDSGDYDMLKGFEQVLPHYFY